MKGILTSREGGYDHACNGSLPKCLRVAQVRAVDNEAFLDMMERYFSQPWDVKLADTRPDLHYQVCLLHSACEAATYDACKLLS